MASSNYRLALIFLSFIFSWTHSWNLHPSSKPWKSFLTTLSITSSVSFLPQIALPTATWSTDIPYPSEIKQIPLYTERSTNVKLYTDISRGFKLLRPFGFNEFEGAGSGYLVKFSSLFDIDENVVVGYSDVSADKKSVTDYGSLERIGEKFAKKRGGKVVEAQVLETEGIIFYQFRFEYPLDTSLPRPRNMKASNAVELYELCVAKGKLWSVQATSNDKLFPAHEKTLRIALNSFLPRL